MWRCAWIPCRPCRISPRGGLDFEPRHQQITLHSIKTWRGGAQFDHANLSSARVVDRQAAGSALQDRLALLLMLEDIRPGDVLEWCYTVESRPLLLPEHCASIFALPAGAPVGKFYFSLLFNPSRPMQWRSSVPEWQPVQKQNNGELLWVWTRDNYPGLRPEENTPGWHIAYPWIQISDCPDWGTVAAAFAEAWKEDEDDATVRKIAGEIAAGEGGILEQTERAIQMVQDEYRYLAGQWGIGRPAAHAAGSGGAPALWGLQGSVFPAGASAQAAGRSGPPRAGQHRLAQIHRGIIAGPRRV